MFSGLRQGSCLYILRIGDGLKMETAEVTSLTQPTMFQPGQFSPKPLMSIQAKADGQNYNFDKIDGTMSVMNDGQGTIIAESRELIVAEVENAVQNSKRILSSMGRNEKIVNDGNRILMDLDPRLRRESEQEQRLTSLEGKLEEILKAINEKSK